MVDIMGKKKGEEEKSVPFYTIPEPRSGANIVYIGEALDCPNHPYMIL